MTTWDDAPPADCDAPESHPDGCACVRPGEEPATWPWDRIRLDGVVIGVPGEPPVLTDPEEIDAALPLAMPEGAREDLRARLRQMVEAGDVFVLPEWAEMRLVGPKEGT